VTYSLTLALQHPILSADEELDLARRYKYKNDLKAAEKLVLSHLRLVMKIAKDFSGYGLNQEDLFQEGTVGLMLAVKKFDPEKGFRLATYATDWIRSKITEFIQKNINLVRRATTKPQLKLFWNQSTVNSHTTEETAKLLGVSEKVVDGFKAANHAEVLLDHGSAGDDKHDWFASDSPGPEQIVVEGLYELDLEKRLKDAMSRLDSRRRKVIEDRMLSEEPKTLKELAGELGVSTERVRQMEAEGIKKLREYMGVDKQF
jgi:RNA polymerase sigma-32 factor